MKGIRKLFFGLIFMTLIGVGFKIDVKAAPTLSFVKPPAAGTEDWSVTNAGLTVKLTGLDDSGYPTTGTEYDYVYKCDVKNGDNIIKTVNVEIKLVGSTRTVTVGGVGGIDVPFDNEIEIITTDSNKSPASFPKSEVITQFDSISGTGEKSLNLTATATTSSAGTPPTIVDGTTTINMYQVDAKAYTTSRNELTATIAGDKGNWFLPGESATITVTTPPDTSTYTFSKWTGGKNSESSGTSLGGNASGVTAPVTSDNKGYFKAWYTVNKPFTATLQPNNSEFGEITSQKTIYGDENNTVLISAEPKSGYAFKEWELNSSGKGTFEVPTSKSTYFKFGNGDAVITAYFEKISTDPHNITVENDGHGTGSASPSSAAAGEWITLTATPNSGYVFDKWTTSDAITINTDNQFKMLDKDVTVKANFKEGSPAGISTVKVTRGQSINLSRFADSAETVVGTVKATSDEVVSVSATGSKTKAGDYTIKGLKTTSSSGIKGLTVNGSQVNVIVYRTPDMYLDTSSASSVLTVEIPTNVYHDKDNTYINWEGVKKAALYFDGSKSQSKGWVYSKLTLDWQELSNKIKEVAKESKETITITAYPVNPDDSSEIDSYVYDTIDIEAYKITLDDSEGAKYTVNGKDVGSYFYAVEGVEYEVKSSAKNTGERIQKWDHDSSLKNETVKFTAEESRTLKAYYSNSSSSSTSSRSSSSSPSTGRTTAAGGSSGSGMDDYDDVPKTGESKADIWILWSVLFISILGAGFMIWKRFGLVKAIAEADEEVAYAEHEEMAEAKKQEKESKLKMLMDLRNLK